MKGFCVLLILFLLCGCAVRSPVPSTGEPAAAAPAEYAGLYDPGSTAEAQTGGALRCFPLNGLSCSGITALEDGLLLFSNQEDHCTVTKLTGAQAVPAARITLPFPISAADASLQIREDGFSCYDPTEGEILCFDAELQLCRRIPVPGELTHSPFLSRDGTTLYYTTPSEIRAQDLVTGISRVIRRYERGEPEIRALLWQDTVLQCTTGEDTAGQQLLCAETGKALFQGEETLLLNTCQTEYWCALTQSSTTLHVFGRDGESANLLLFPQPDTRGIYLPGRHAALGLHREGEAVTIDYYDLTSGRRTSGIRFGFREDPTYFTVFADRIWFLSDGNLYCWDIHRSSVRDDQVCTAPYMGQNTQNSDAYRECLKTAEAMTLRYSIPIRIRDENTAPFRFTYLHQPAMLMQELARLDRLLRQYPGEILTALARRFEGMTICIVSGTGENPGISTPDPACGALLWDDYHAYIALTAGSAMDGPLNHAFCHLMDTVVLNESSAYDTWNTLNPTGFVYDCDYAANQTRNSTAYLQDSHRYFVDMYAMSYPKEDRARIFEAAMTPENSSLFTSSFMQAKLAALCRGIREAFDLEDDPRQFPWEQYLEISAKGKR